MTKRIAAIRARIARLEAKRVGVWNHARRDRIDAALDLAWRALRSEQGRVV